MFYSSQPEEARLFINDKLGFPSTDVGDGWLMFQLSSADLGCNPAINATGKTEGSHDLSLYCDDIEGTVADIRSKGVSFVDEVQDAGYGHGTRFALPGGVDQRSPRHQGDES